jgi:hypothetical protein
MANNQGSFSADACAGGKLFKSVASDTTNPYGGDGFFKAIMLETQGALSIAFLDNSVVNYPAGFFALQTLYPLPHLRVMATGTAATVWSMT